MCGTGTKISKYLINHDKVYEAEIKLGEITDTLDREGEILEKKQVELETLEQENVIKALERFVGKQEQVPPIYSAIKVNGKKLYEYARQGREIEIPPRQIEIYDIELQNIDSINYIIKIKVHVSKGTYIRTLCKDIAESLGTIGYMNNLRRLKVGEFSIENAIPLEEIQKNKNNIDFFIKKIISIEKIFEKEPRVILNNKKLELFFNGVKLGTTLEDGICKIYNDKNIFIGIGTIKENKLKRDIII